MTRLALEGSDPASSKEDFGLHSVGVVDVVGVADMMGLVFGGHVLALRLIHAYFRQSVNESVFYTSVG